MPIRSYGVMLIIGFLVGYWLASRRAERFGIKRSQVADMAIWALLAGIVGARVGWVVQEFGYYLKNPVEIFKLTEGGMTSYGGILFAFLAVWIWSRIAKVRLSNVLDLLAAPALVMHGFGRIGCFLNGCCYGAPCSLPWAVSVHPDSGSAYMGHPAQLYDTLMAFFAAGMLLLYERATLQNRRPGQYASLFFILYGVTRFVYEFFRAGYSSTSSLGLPITDAQIAAAAMIFIGAIWFAIAARRANLDATVKHG